VGHSRIKEWIIAGSRLAYFPQVLQYCLVPDTGVVVVPESVGLVLLVVTLVAIQAPVDPVQVQLPQVPNQVLPRLAPAVVPELPQDERHSHLVHPSHEQLLVVQFLPEPGLAPRLPPRLRPPREPIQVSAVDQLVGGVELERVGTDGGEVELVVESADDDEHVGGVAVYPVGDGLCGQPPVELGAISPGGLARLGGPDFVPQVHPYDKLVAAELLGQVFQTLEELGFRVLLVEPQPVPVAVAAAPLRLAGVVVQDHHQSRAGQFLHSVHEYLFGGPAVQTLVGLDELWVDVLVLALPLPEQFQGEGHANAVHHELELDVGYQVLEGPAVQPTQAVPGRMASRPAAPHDLHPRAQGIDDCHSLGGEREADQAGVVEYGVFSELQLQALVVVVESNVPVKVDGGTHAML